MSLFEEYMNNGYLNFNINLAHKIIFIALFFFFQVLHAEDGGNSTSGGNPEKIMEASLKLLLEEDGLKKAMINYLKTIIVDQIEDVQVREKLKVMMKNNSLLNDIMNSKYVVKTQCFDAYDHSVSASTKVGELNSDICFDIEKLSKIYVGLGDENVMIRLASLAFHEHTHHFQSFSPSKKSIRKNEDEANFISGYISITAKFVQLPILKWTAPKSGNIQFQEIQSLYNEIKAKEQAFIAPASSDYDLFPDFRGQLDKGIIRLLPMEKYDRKISINGGASFYSFVNLTHEYGFGDDINLENEKLTVGFAGCNFGYIVDLGQISLKEVTLSYLPLKFLINFQVAKGEPQIRVQQRATRDGVMINSGGTQYTFNRSLNAIAGHTYVLRSINFDRSDILVAIHLIRFDPDGSLILAWKKLKEFEISSCR